MARRKVHYVTKAVFRRRVPLPPVCGNRKATSITTVRNGVTCKHCLMRI